MNFPTLRTYGGALLPPPSRDWLIKPRLTFQGGLIQTQQFGLMPSFEACLPWLTPQDRRAYYQFKRTSSLQRIDKQNDTHAIVTLPDGVPLYDEANQFFSPDKFGALDWTQRNTTIESKFTDLLLEVIGAGFPGILLYLGGDGDGNNYKIAFTQLELLAQNTLFRTLLYKYCFIVPGWDGVFYGWPLEQIMLFGQRFRQLFPDGHLALHYSTGHIPVGEGGADYLPRNPGQSVLVNPGRMADYDLLIGEYDYNVHLDSAWQILNRMERDFTHPPDQPADDDPGRKYYLGTPNARGAWGHFVMEAGEYESVRVNMNDATAVAASVQHCNDDRAYLKYKCGCDCLG